MPDFIGRARAATDCINPIGLRFALYWIMIRRGHCAVMRHFVVKRVGDKIGDGFTRGVEFSSISQRPLIFLRK